VLNALLWCIIGGSAEVLPRKRPRSDSLSTISVPPLTQGGDALGASLVVVPPYAEPVAKPMELGETPVVNIASSPDEGPSSRSKGSSFTRAVFPELEEVKPAGPRWALPTEDILGQPYTPGFYPLSSFAFLSICVFDIPFCF
jgi:hypothetical protein